ncbi:MAG TPA: cation-transporting P-type ATPase, partial [Ornithinimicrobium sp.]|nr:cation-transporting P-type ATPase [Ornithinimicrobium sp.]
MSGPQTPEPPVAVDACGCEVAAGRPAPAGEVEEPTTTLWRVREVQLGLLSGVLLGAGLLAGSGGWRTVELVLAAAAL